MHTYNFKYDDIYKDDSITTIEKCSKRIQEEERIIETHNFNIDTLNYRKVSLIRGLIVPFSESVLKIGCVNEFISLKKKDFIEKYDNEKYKAVKKDYELLKMVIEDDVLGNDNKYDYKITGVIKGGFETYYTAIYFTVNNIDFVFNLPHPNKINLDNCVYAHDGMYCLEHKESCCLRYIEGSYYINDIKKAFKEFIEKESNNA